MADATVRTLSPTEARLLNELAAAGKTIFATEDARAIMNGQGERVNKLLYRLTQKRWLFRLEKGKYLILPLEAGMEGLYTVHEFLIAAHLVKPHAIAYASALSFHGLTDQVARTVFVASTSRRQNVTIESLGLHYRFITLTEDKFFGLETVAIEDQPVQITDPSKTIVDGLDHPEYCGGIVEMAKGLWRYHRSEVVDPSIELRTRLDRLTCYALRLGNRTVFKRLGYLAEVLGLDVGEYLTRWQGEVSAGMGLLDPRYGERGPYNTRWNLRLNVDPYRLTEWQEH